MKHRVRLTSLARHALFSLTALMMSAFLSGVTSTREAQACGVNSHLWITDSAICQLPMTSPLRALYEEQIYVDLTRLGSAFPDSGYAINHDYGEAAHWPPFIQAYIEDFHARFGADDSAWDEEALREVAFVLGVAAHGVEDELFDSQYLRLIEQEDEAGQDVVDPGIDFLLVYEGHTELYPPNMFPVSGVTSALQRAEIEVSEDEVALGVARVRLALSITQSPRESLRSQVERVTPLMPWAARHYLDQGARGSLGHEPRIIAALLWATYQRLRGESVSNLALASVDPAPPEALPREGVTARDESRWISLYFAVAAESAGLAESLHLYDEEGAEVDYEWRDTRWGGGRGFTHIFEVSPRSLSPEQSALTLKLDPGVLLINGEVTRDAFESMITVCDGADCVNEPLPEARRGGRARGCWVDPESDMSPVESALDAALDSTLDSTLDSALDVALDSYLDVSDGGVTDDNPNSMTPSRDAGAEERGAKPTSANSGCDQQTSASLHPSSSSPRLSLIALLITLLLTLSAVRRVKHT